MKNISILAGAAGVLVAMTLAAGCVRPAAPDVVPTAGAEAVGTPAGEEMPEDVVATAAAESAALTATAQAAPTEEPTPVPPPPTAEPTVEPTPIPTPVPTPEPTPIPPTAATSPPTTHVVQSGENLFRIALRYGTTVQAIASANGIVNPHLIYVGQVLTIPSGPGPVTPPPAGETTYIVQPGDNLFRIALRFNMSYLYLAQYNGIANPAVIYVGQVIRIPAR